MDDLVASRTNVRWGEQLALAQVESARESLALHDYGGASQQAARALATSAAGLAVTPNDVDLIVLAADADIVAGQIAAKRADANGAHDYWVRARDTVAPLGHTGDPNLLAVYASALILLNNLDAARPLLQKLGAMGYRTADFNALLTEKKSHTRP